MKTFALLTACIVGAASTFAQAANEAEIARVESRFVGKSLSQITLALAAMRPDPVSRLDKAIVMRELPMITERNRVASPRQLDRLYARLETTLRFYHRYGVVDLVIFRDPRPIIYSMSGVVLVISTEVLKIVGDDDGALAGMVAHELAHECVAMEMLQAFKTGDLARMRELELFCDAAAVVALLDLDFDPDRYANALKRIASHSPATAFLNDGSISHPAIDARLRLISDISGLLINESRVARLRK
jgi:Zn-dependent protease with chaperone function